jgi:hypothetical protein
MRFNWHCVRALIICSFLQLVCSGSVFSQSSVIRLPLENQTNTTLFASEPANNLPKLFLETERILEKPLPTYIAGEIFFMDLKAKLASMGLQVMLNESAKDTLSLDTELEIPAPGKSVDANLRLMLERYDCTYTVDRSGVIIILSVDDAESEMTNVTIDVTGMSDDFYDLVYVIQEAIEPDQWESNGGVGRAAPFQANEREFIAFEVPYQMLRKIREYFASLNTMGSTSDLKLQTAKMRYKGSTVVQLPGMGSEDRYAKGRRRMDGLGGGDPATGPIGGGGFGGGGLGGGVF